MVRLRTLRRDKPHLLDATGPFSPLPTLAKGTLKIAEKCGVATAIFEHGQWENEGLAFTTKRCAYSTNIETRAADFDKACGSLWCRIRCVAVLWPLGRESVGTNRNDCARGHPSVPRHCSVVVVSVQLASISVFNK